MAGQPFIRAVRAWLDMTQTSVGTSADAARRSACATGASLIVVLAFRCAGAGPAECRGTSHSGLLRCGDCTLYRPG